MNVSIKDTLVKAIASAAALDDDELEVMEAVIKAEIRAPSGSPCSA
jgi:hypothetical protein